MQMVKNYIKIGIYFGGVGFSSPRCVFGTRFFRNEFVLMFMVCKILSLWDEAWPVGPTPL
jgi:hypothetical protein